MGTMANSEDPDEMPHKAAFHQGLHCCQDEINFQRMKSVFSGSITCDPSTYTMDNSDFIVSIFMETSIGLKRVKFNKTFQHVSYDKQNLTLVKLKILTKDHL